MNPFTRLAVVFSASLCISLSCATTEGERSDSQTHFFSPCASDGDCGGLFSCLCGRCTQACEQSCSGSLGARCLPPESDAVAALCGGGATSTSLCVPTCSDDAPCKEGTRCQDGTCRVTVLEDAGTADVVTTDCSSFQSRSACEQASQCRPLIGRSRSADRFAGCMASDRACEDALTCARSPDDSEACYEFSDGCIPAGWEDVPCDSRGCLNETVVATVSDCRLETLVDYVIESQATLDCGTLPLSATDEEITTALSCIADARAAGNPYRAIWAMQGIDSEIRQGIVGLVEGGQARTYSFFYDSLGFSPYSSNAEWSLCDDLTLTVCPTERICVECERNPAVHCDCRMALTLEGPGSVYCAQ